MRDFAVLAAAGLLASLAFPNELVSQGLPFLGPLLLLPVFWFTARHRPWASAGAGVLWFVLLTLASQSWLLAFHPLAFPFVIVFAGLLYALAFGVSSLLWRSSAGLWLQALWWTGFEFLRLQGFLAYPYTSVASTVWTWPLLFQSADLVGASGVTFLLAWTSAWLAAFLHRPASWKRLKLDLTLGLALWGANLAYGAIRWNEAASGAIWRPALVQHAQDPWSDEPSHYEVGLERLETLSRQALLAAPDAVVWSETAFVPSVEFHTRYHENPNSLRLVRRLETFLRSQSTPFLVGNGHREKASDGSLLDYNAVLAWDGGWKGRYEKNRLVPFTEHFPYGDLFPWVEAWLRAADTHFWEPGRAMNTLTVGGVIVGTPICFEDAFPEGSRAFAQAGAQALVNLTNDSWAPGQASRYQHLSLAVFRSVETRLPLVRAGNDGATAAVSARGEVLAWLPIGETGVLQTEVRLGGGQTLYTQWGDVWAWFCLVVTAGALVWPRRSVVDKGPEL